MNDTKEVLRKRPGLELKSIAIALNTSYHTVYSSINFHNNSEKAKAVREKYKEMLLEELRFIEENEKIFN